jgi:ABC-type multidrug transport system ATPase subunit
MILACVDIGFKYPGTAVALFQNLSFTVTEPGFHALFGPSGVGKTSLARMLTGDLSPEAGHIQFAQDAKLLYSYNLERLPGWSAVSTHLHKITPEAHKRRKAALIETFGLQACLSSRFPNLSLGQQNRVNLLRYLLQDFAVLIMDESLANVDERTREKIILKIKRMFPGQSFLYISHNVIEVAKYCDAIYVLRSAVKTPQVATVRGMDYRGGQDVDRGRLERVMLEVMNAA